jgi:uncharacterized protein
MSFAVASWAGALSVVALAHFRSRAYATFRLIQLSLHTLLAIYRYHALPAARPLFWFLNAVVLLSAMLLVRPQDRGPLYRALISVPAAFYQSATFFAWPWALVSVLGGRLPWPWLPLVGAFFGVVQSLVTREQTVSIFLDGQNAPTLGRHRSHGTPSARPLKLVQITDPHLGPFMSVARLRRICTRAVAREPDLILLTGDFLTMESMRDPSLLETALQPLLAYRGRVFACLGNHDYEALAIVQDALHQNGVQLLVDDVALVETPAGPVQIVGADFVWRDRPEHLRRLMERYPKIEGTLQLVLLHDPSAFRHLPLGSADLVLSGHTHGGQVGLLSLGLDWTFLRLFRNLPDHGLWARGSDRMYIHRGTGHYGFPVRLGVPAEESLLLVHRTSEDHLGAKA